MGVRQMSASLFARALTILAMSMVTAVSASAQNLTVQPTAPKAETPQESPGKEVAVEPQAADVQIAKRLEGILEATGWFIAPKVVSREGVVFLDGITRDESHREWATKLAQNTQDVVAVVNKIEVRPEVSWNLDGIQSGLKDIYWGAARSLPLLVLAVFVLGISWILAAGVAMLARQGLQRKIPSPLLLKLAARAIAIPVFLLGLYFVLKVSNLTGLALTVLGGTGIIGIVLGFASRDIVENFLASFFLSLNQPFRTGDYIVVSGSEGIVQSLNTRSTVLLTLDGALVQIPNATVFKDKITNHSSSPYRRSEFRVGVGYDCALSDAQNLILDVLKAHEGVLSSPEPLVLVDDLGSATVGLRCLYWFDSKTYSPIKIKSALLRQTKRTLVEAGIPLPDETREVIFPQGVPVTGPNDRKPSTPASRKMDKSSEQAATAAEGGLRSEESQLLSTAGEASLTIDSPNLLDPKKGT